MKNFEGTYTVEWGADNFRTFKSGCLLRFLSMCNLLEEETKPTGFLAKVYVTAHEKSSSPSKHKVQTQPVLSVGGHRTTRILDELLKINKRVGLVCPFAESEVLMTYATFKR
jgi:hypothetical protein